MDLRGFFGVADVPAGFQDVTFTVDISSPGHRRILPVWSRRSMPIAQSWTSSRSRFRFAVSHG